MATLPAIEAITGAGIPVVGHFGVQGERSVMSSGYAPRGRDAADAVAIVRLARACVDAGIVAALCEHTAEEVTKYLWETLPVSILSLGSGAYCDGIFHVSVDVAGISAFPTPPMRESFADAWGVTKSAYQEYYDRVKAETYPKPANSHHMYESEHERFLEQVAELAT